MTQFRNARWMPWAVGVLALVVAGWRSWTPGPWHDEIATLTATERSWGALFSMLHRVDAVHALYYTLGKAWSTVFGATIVSLRALSVLAVAANAVLLTKLGSRLLTPTAGVVAGVGLVLLPRAEWSATEARSYALSALLVTVVVYCLVRALEQGHSWWPYGLSLWAAATLFVYSVLIVPVLIAVMFLQRPPARLMRGFFAATTVALVGVVPVGLLMVAERGAVLWLQRVTSWDVVLSSPAAVFFDNRSVALITWALLLLAGLLVLVQNIRRPLSGQVSLLRPGALLALVLGWSLVPLAILEAVSTQYALYYPRYMTMAGPGVALLLGACAVGVAERWRAVVALTLVAAVAYVPWSRDRRWDSKDVLPEVAAAVSSLRRPGDALLFPQRPAGSDRTSRTVMYAYPQAFSGLPDLTIKDSYETSGQLWETDVPLAAVASRLTTVKGVIRVGFGGARNVSVEDRRLLNAAGLRQIRYERMRDWTVILFERQQS